MYTLLELYQLQMWYGVTWEVITSLVVNIWSSDKLNAHYAQKLCPWFDSETMLVHFAFVILQIWNHNSGRIYRSYWRNIFFFLQSVKYCVFSITYSVQFENIEVLEMYKKNTGKWITMSKSAYCSLRCIF